MNSQGKSDYLHCVKLEHWVHECTNLNGKQIYKFKHNKLGRVHTQVSEIVEE